MLNQCMETLLEEAKDKDGPLSEVFLIESLGAIYYDELQAALAGEAVSKAQVDAIFGQLSDLLTNPDFKVLVRQSGKIVATRRDLVQEALEMILEAEEGASGKKTKKTKISKRGMANFIDLFLEKRRVLQEKCPSGLYAVDVLWQEEEKREMTLLEAIKTVVEELRKAKEKGEGGGGGKKKRKRG